MMTKRQLARCIVEEYKRKNHLPDEMSDESLVQFVYSSSRLAVALETLGVEMPDNLKEYCSHRGGVMYIYHEPPKDGNGPVVTTLCARDIIEMLPD